MMTEFYLVVVQLIHFIRFASFIVYEFYLNVYSS